MLEQDIQKSILDYLQYLPGCLAWRQNTGAFSLQDNKGKHRFFRAGSPGMADIIGIYKGKPIAIEVKRPGGKTTLNQDLFLEKFKAVGGHAIVAYSLNDVIKFIEEL